MTMDPRVNPDPELLNAYVEHGHRGFILWFRSRNNGNDPNPTLLHKLMLESEHRRLGRGGRLFKGLVDVLVGE